MAAVFHLSGAGGGGRNDDGGGGKIGDSHGYEAGMRRAVRFWTNKPACPASGNNYFLWTHNNDRFATDMEQHLHIIISQVD
jgi:hypothetical protein